MNDAYTRDRVFRIILGLAVGIFFLAVSGLDVIKAAPRSVVARAQNGQRTLAAAIEKYFADYNTYPAWAIGKEGSNGFLRASSPASGLPTFRVELPEGVQGALHTLTTPHPYVESLADNWTQDPFAQVKGVSFAYWTTTNKGVPGYILWSPGPDQRYDLTIDNIAQAYDPASGHPTPYLIERTYDPTNGAVSPGDIWIVKP